jgi:hypothetical protein
MELGLVKFKVEDATIAKLAAEYMPLKIEGIKDIAGYAMVHQARMVVKDLRIGITKTGKAWRDQVNVHINDELSEEKRLLGLIKPIESHLDAQETTIDNEKARIKAEVEEVEKKRIQSRINRLFAFGCTFDGITYRYKTVAIGHFEIGTLSDVAFEAVCAKMQALVDIEIAEQEEALRKHQVEEKRQAAERAKLEAIALEQAKKEETLKKEEARIAREQAEKAEIIRKDQERREAALKQKADKLEADKRKLEEKVRLEEARKEAAEKAKIETEARIKREEEEKAWVEKRAKEEAARQEALRPDKEKLMAFFDELSQITGPDVKSKEAKAVLKEALKIIDQARAFLNIETKKL